MITAVTVPAAADRSSDYRLVVVAAGTWLAAYAALFLPARAALAVAGGALAAAALLWRRLGRPAPGPRRSHAGPGRARPGASPVAAGGAGVIVALLLGLGCGAAATGARLLGRDDPAIATPAGTRATVTAELTVRRDPRQLGTDAGRPPAWLVPARLHRIETATGATRLRARVLVFGSDPRWQQLRPGQRLRTAARLAPPEGGDLTAAVLSATGVPELIGEPPWVQRAAGSVRAGLQAAAAPLPDEPGGLVPGLAIGDVSTLDPGLSEDFRTAGMTHLLAVSGSNVAIVVGLVFLLARAGRAPPWLTAVASGGAMVGYVILCRAEPSVLRAATMGAIALVALATGRLRAALPALAAAVIGLVVIDPQLAGDAGFALSVFATAGLLVLAPGWRDRLRRRGVPPGLAEALVVPAAAQLAVAPVIAGLSGSISLVAVAANLLAAPAVAPVTVLGVLAAAVAPAWLPAAAFLAWLASWPAWWLVLVARYAAGLPGAAVPWPDGVTGALSLAGLTLVMLVAARHRPVRRLVAVTAAAVVVGALPVRTVASGWPPAGAVLVACAVGQGDLLVVPVGPAAGVVIDAGPEPAAADRCLRDLGIRSVPLLVVSHFHADHIGGVAGVFRRRPVRTVLTTGWPEPAAGPDRLREVAGAAGAVVRPAEAGAAYQVGPVRLTVLGPPYDLRGTRSDPNNNSLVAYVEVHGVGVLLPGDAEIELQRALLADPGPDRLRADVLKLPHHGSAYQDPDFLAAVDPAVALVPVGADNGYGHPHPAVLDRLAGDGARVLRTDLDGDVAAVLRGGSLAVVARAPPPGVRR